MVAGPHEAAKGTIVEDQDLTIRVDGTTCEVTFAEIPDVPEALQAWATDRE